MTKDEAEAKIVHLCLQLDAVGLMNLSKPKKDGRLAEIGAEITELKKITGKRHITGTFSAG